MAIFWDFLQDHRYFRERRRSEALDTRVAHLEKELAEQRDLIKKLLYALEERLGDDLDGDGVTGRPPAKKIKVRKSRDNDRVRKQLERQTSSGWHRKP